jgi:hypothetical protein
MIEMSPHIRRALLDAHADELRQAAEVDRLVGAGRVAPTGHAVGHRMTTLLVRVAGVPGHHYVRPRRSPERCC